MSVEDIERPVITPQQYEVLHGGGAEAAEIARQRLSRRRFLRRSMLAVWGTSTVASVAGALAMVYPTLGGGFGSDQIVGKISEFAAGKPEEFALDTKGVYHRPAARAYVVHLAANTPFLLNSANLNEQLDSEWVHKDEDGSFWIALYQKCVHLGCTVPFKNSCLSFKCPCHGSHYNVDGEFLDGPAPRSLDRFRISLNKQTGDVIVSTGAINSNVAHPDSTTRLIAAPSVECSV